MRGRILEAIAVLSENNGRPPTNREIGDYLGGKSTGHIDYHLRVLKDQGKILHESKKSRGISIAASLENEPIPLRGKRVPVMGTIAAGRPIEAVLDPDNYVTVPGVTEDNLFALRVRDRVPGSAPEATPAAENSTGAGGRVVPVFWPDAGERTDTMVYDGTRLAGGATVSGPALVELPHTTVAVPRGATLTADRGHFRLLLADREVGR